MPLCLAEPDALRRASSTRFTRPYGYCRAGKEGPNCDVPINECVRGTASCSPRATCIDTEAGYECRCFW